MFNVAIRLRKLLLSLHTGQSSLVMTNLPHLSSYTHQCLKEGEYDKAFVNIDYCITVPAKAIPIRSGNVQVTSKPFPFEIQEHTSLALSKTLQVNKRELLEYHHHTFSAVILNYKKLCFLEIPCSTHLSCLPPAPIIVTIHLPWSHQLTMTSQINPSF